MDIDGARHDRRREHKRARSPDGHRHARDVKRHRSQSPRRCSHRQTDGKAARAEPALLPFRARSLQKHDFESYRALFAEYLDVQKQIDLQALGEDEVKGRWKSFLGKWNRAELAEGWYDPETKRRVDDRPCSVPARQRGRIVARENVEVAGSVEPAKEADDEDDGYGPAPPETVPGGRVGPAIPTLQDLQHKRELAEEDHEAHIADLRHTRKLDRQAQKERLDELIPRTDPGSRERQLEKKRETTAANRAFASAKDSGDVEVAESELMGEDGTDGYKAKLKASEKQKNERELRKEEVLRARAAEREEKIAELRKKEERTLEMLRGLARQRFG